MYRVASRLLVVFPLWCCLIGLAGPTGSAQDLLTPDDLASDGQAMFMPELEEMDACYLECPECAKGSTFWNCLPRPSGIYYDAWVAQGFTWNPDSPDNRFNTPVTFNDRANEYQMNQFYLVLGRALKTDGYGWSIGGRVDLLYGTDYFFTTATGLETHRDGTGRWNSDNGPRGAGSPLYGLAMPQLYAEVYAPLGNGLTVKMGHFYTIFGCESVMAPDNFFYSHSYTMQYGEPFTHTGLLASYDLTPQLTIHAGFTRGWDAWEPAADEMGFLCGAGWTSRDGRTDLAFALHTGNEDITGQDNRTAYSLVLNRQVTDSLTYVIQHDLGVEEDALIGRQGSATWYGINQYLLYDMTETTALGLRFEWFHDRDNARVLGVPIQRVVTGGNYFAFTLGLNWELTDYMTFRPEARWDWSDVEAPQLGAQGMFDDFSDKNQFTLGMDLIVRF